MNKEFVTYEQALALKELGFDEPYYFATYLDSANLIPREEEDGWDLSKGIIAPLYQQAFRWFREKHELYVDLFVDDEKTFGFMISYFVGKEYTYERIDKPIQRKYSTHEEAEQACLDRLIEIVRTTKP